MRDSYIFYGSFYEAIKEMLPDDRLRIYDAINEYALNGAMPELTGVCRAIMSLIKPQLDANRKRYENGLKGGRPRRIEAEPDDQINQNQTNGKPNDNQSTTKRKANNNDNDNQNDNANAKEDVDKKFQKFCLTFIEEPYRQVFEMWLQYKVDRSESYRTQQSIEVCYRKLLNLSGGDPQVAADVVEQSIANNYAGLFELKQGNKTRNAPEKSSYVF